MTIRRHIIACAVVFLAATGLAGTVRAQDPDDVKPTYIIPSPTKGGLCSEDRETVEDFLAENHSKLRAAPRELVALLEATGVWTEQYSEYAQPVPRRLDRKLSPSPEGTYRLIFDRALYVINAESGRVLTRVDASE